MKTISAPKRPIKHWKYKPKLIKPIISGEGGWRRKWKPSFLKISLMFLVFSNLLLVFQCPSSSPSPEMICFFCISYRQICILQNNLYFLWNNLYFCKIQIISLKIICILPKWSPNQWNNWYFCRIQIISLKIMCILPNCCPNHWNNLYFHQTVVQTIKIICILIAII